MMGFVIAVIMVAAIGSLVWLIDKATDGSVLAGAAATGLVAVLMGVIINASIKEGEKGPCHQYETRLMYNAATKTMMPSRVCVLRGEWVEEDHDNK